MTTAVPTAHRLEKSAIPVFSERAASPRAAEARRGRVTPALPILPKISPLLLRWFTWYSRRYLCRHFHSLRVSRAGHPPPADGRPLVVYSNHASWWDALVCLVLKDAFYPEYSAFTPMDAAMLERYRFFRRLGFFGVEPRSRRGAAQFLGISEAVLRSRRQLVALTPQAGFVDVRQRPIRFAGGIGHLAVRVPGAYYVPVAMEYVFWEERLPEILVRFGEPVSVRTTNALAPDAESWTRRFEQSLADTQDALAAEAQRRRPDDFQTLLRGGAGQGTVYDRWRALKAWCRGESFQPEHGNK